MTLSDELVSELVKITNDRERSGDDNKVVYGTTVDDGTRQYVRIDGSGELTPVITTATIKAGDRVTVAIRNHTALVTGNVDDPSASSLKLEEVIVRINSIDEDINGIGIVINDMTGEVEGIAAKVDGQGIEIDNLGTRIGNEVANIDVRMNEIEASVGEVSATVTDHGVIFAGLADGTTTIDGACIKTGTIDADRINMTGAITWNDLSSDVQTDIESIEDTANTANNTANSASSTASSAYNKATTAQNTANNTKTLVNGLTITEGTKTYIDGEMIYSKSIYADRIHLGGQLDVYKTIYGTEIGGYLGWCSGWDSSEGIGIMHSESTGQCICTDEAARLSWGSAYIDSNGNMASDTTANKVVASSAGVYVEAMGEVKIVANSQPIYIDSSMRVQINIDGNGRGYFSDTVFHGYKVLTLGSAGFPWPTIYGATNSITVSDRNKKNSIEDLPDKYVTLFDNITPKRFKMNDGTSDRYHVGYIAQEVEEAMSISGIDSQEFGGFVRGHEEDEDGNSTGEETLMLRYEEFNAIYAAKIKQIEATYEARFEHLENKIKQLEERLAALET